MKSCNGCKYLVKHPRIDLCSHDDPKEYSYETNPYTGNTHRLPLKFRPSIKEMRAEGGKCGHEAELYSPTLFRRFLLWIMGKLLLWISKKGEK
jgi:hypothetical protein